MIDKKLYKSIPVHRCCKFSVCSVTASLMSVFFSHEFKLFSLLSLHQVLDCFHLNTPTPIMSACPAPPTRPDPFRSGPHPTRDLGSLTTKVNPLHLPVRPTRVVLQLTQEEDQAVTNLLQLHHQEEPLHWGSSEGGVAPLWNDVPCAEESRLQQGRRWSDTELEAANTLLRGFSPIEKDATASNQ